MLGVYFLNKSSAREDDICAHIYLYVLVDMKIVKVKGYGEVTTMLGL